MKKHATTFFVIALGIGVLLSVAASVLSAICGTSLPLPQGETCAQCVREWIGALSGWVAAAAAFAVGWATLGPLIRQTKHTERQERQDCFKEAQKMEDGFNQFSSELETALLALGVF